MSTTSAGRQLVDALRGALELEFFGVPLASSGSRTPTVVWRYVPSDGAEQLASQINEIIRQSLTGCHVEWELRKPGRNWVLAPKRFLDLEDSGQFRTFPEVLKHIDESDPAFAALAHADLRKIADQVSQLLSALKRTDLR